MKNCTNRTASPLAPGLWLIFGDLFLNLYNLSFWDPILGAWHMMAWYFLNLIDSCPSDSSTVIQVFRMFMIWYLVLDEGVTPDIYPAKPTRLSKPWAPEFVQVQILPSLHYGSRLLQCLRHWRSQHPLKMEFLLCQHLNVKKVDWCKCWLSMICCWVI